jgi:hypothetical protein
LLNLNLHQVNKVHLLLAVLVTLIGTAFILLATRWPLTADTAGYEYAARQLMLGNGLGYDDENNELAGEFFSPFAFQIKHFEDSRLYLGYPPGFPLLLALPGFVTGVEETVHYVVPITAAIGIFLTFLLGKWITKNEWLALFAAGIVALMPNYWLFGTEAWSEVPSMVFVLIGYLFYFYSRHEGVSERARVFYALLGGSALIFSLFIRYANITFLLSLGLAELLINPREMLRPSKRWFFYGTLFLGLLLILAFNHFYYGGIRLTSYSPENGWYLFPPFSLSYALGSSPIDGYSLIEAGKSLWKNFSIILFFIPVGWLVLPRYYRLIVLLSIVGSVGLYSLYAFAPVGINSRFLVPTFPFLAILGAQGSCYFLHKLKNKHVQLLVICFLLAGLGWNLWPEASQLRTKNRGAETAVSRLRSWLEVTEENAVIMSYALNDRIAYYGDRSVLNYRRIPQYDPATDKYRYDLFEPCLVYVVDTLLLASKPVYFHEDRSPTLYDAKDILEEHYLLSPVLEEPTVFRVTNASLTTVREDAHSCTPQAVIQISQK